MTDIPDGMMHVEPFIKMYKCPTCSEIFYSDDKHVKNNIKIIELAFLSATMTITRCPECGQIGSL